MIMRKSNKKDGEPLTLNEMMTTLNNLFASRKDDPKAMDIKSMIQSLLGEEHDEKAEDDVMTACPDGLDPEGIDISNEDLSGGMIGYSRVVDAVEDESTNIITHDINGVDVPVIAFIAPNNMMEGVVDSIRSMNRPTIIAKECITDNKDSFELVVKSYIACGENRENLIKKHGTIKGLAFDEKGGMCRLSINRKDGYEFIFGENAVTRFIIFDENVCPDTIPTDIVKDDRKWGKRMTSELPKLIEQRIEESKSNEKKLPFADAVKPALTKIDIPNLTEKKTPLCNLPETCTFEETPYNNIKQPIIADIMKDFTEAKGNGKVGKDTFVEFMKPENKEAVATAVATSIAERQNPSDDVIEKDEVTKAVESAIYENAEDDFSDEDTNPDCFRCIAEYMAKEGVDSINFWTDGEGLIHCDVQIKTVYKVELEDSEKK